MSLSILLFAATIVLTLVITVWASRRSGDVSELYTAGGRITGGQNGLAIAGDFLSATTLLGVTGLFFAGGVDAGLYFLCPLVGFGLMLLLIAGPLRRLGRFTLGDVVETQLGDRRLRLFSGVTTVVVCLIYLVAQMVGAGSLISILFGLSFNTAVVIVGGLVAVYVAFGGMLAATWVQMVKAVMLSLAVIVLAILVLVTAGGAPALYDGAARAHALGEGLYRSGGMGLDLFSAASLSAGLILGMLGLPHVLIRLLTVPDEKAAKKSIVVATSLTGLIFALLFAVVGPGAVLLVTGQARFEGADGKILGGGNMAIMHLARALGGEAFFGIMAAVAFATVLAVGAGRAIAAATALTHDLYRSLRPVALDERTERRVFRLATLALLAISVLVAIVFQKENTAFLASLAFAVAASASFPVLVLAIYWRGLTAAGALWGGATGLAASSAFIVLGPSVWVKALGHAQPVVPWDHPTLITAPLAFAVIVAVSRLTARRA